jgi:sugar phosphate isomerase/epimerase
MGLRPHFVIEDFSMMRLGFVSAILPDLSLEEVVEFAAGNGFTTVELMCWPVGKAERRYAGVTHIDATGFTREDAARINALVAAAGLTISGLGYYPNPLAPAKAEAQVYIDHIQQVILAAELLGVEVMNTFVGRDWTKTVEENWPRLKEVWPPLVQFAEEHGVKIAIENCPMAFTQDEWPGGKNLAHTPAIWRRMFEELPSANFGLNYDPSHMIWQHMDYLNPLREFKDKLFHIHAKDVRLDRQRLNDVGIMATPLEFHTPKLPGLGDIDWGQFFSVLSDVGYDGPVCIEVEDRAYEASLQSRQAAIVQSGRYLKNFMA